MNVYVRESNVMALDFQKQILFPCPNSCDLTKAE